MIMWTLFVFDGPIRKARPFECVMVEGGHVRDTEKRFKEEIGWDHLTFPYRTFSAEKKQWAWDRAIEVGIIPRYRSKQVWRPGGKPPADAEEYPTVSHPDHYLNQDRGAKLLPIVKVTPDNSLCCVGCNQWFRWVSPNQPDGYSFKCRDCRGEF
jgi:hypothetical protein